MEKLWRRVEWFTERSALAAVWEGKAKKPQPLGWRLVTLTMPRPADPWTYGHLRSQVKRARAAWGETWRSLAWGRQVNYTREDGRRSKRKRRDTAFAMGLEVGPSGNVHVHAAVFGEFIAQRTIEAAWREALGYSRAELQRQHGTSRLIVHVTKIRAQRPEDLKDALREVLKYTAKGQKGALRYERAAMIERAFKSVRRVEMGGALRQMPEVTAQELAVPPKACEDCGAEAGYAWLGVNPPVMVLKNRGFGPVRTEEARAAAERAGYWIDGGIPPWWWDEDLINYDPDAAEDAALAFFDTCHAMGER